MVPPNHIFFLPLLTIQEFAMVDSEIVIPGEAFSKCSSGKKVKYSLLVFQSAQECVHKFCQHFASNEWSKMDVIT